MSQVIDLEGKRQYSHTIDRSTFRDSSASYPQNEKQAIYPETPCSGSFPPSETVYNLHTQDDFPDGGLRAWLVVLGVRFFGYLSVGGDKPDFRVHALLSQRELLYAVALFFQVDCVVYRFGYVNSFGVSGPPILAWLPVLIVVLYGYSRCFKSIMRASY